MTQGCPDCTSGAVVSLQSVYEWHFLAFSFIVTAEDELLFNY